MAEDKKLICSDRIKKNAPLFLLLAAAFLIFASKATAAGLWYDEAVDYFYSKIINGPVPGDFGKETMYERICFTYQPPLYNVLTHIWLRFFDSEFSFRILGVITTLAGAVGMYLAISRVADIKWAFLGTAAYIFTGQISYYALECAEYNLMLACVSWLIYFMVMCLKEKERKYLTGFFVTACLAAYSQYGAALLIIGMFSALLFYYIRSGKEMIKPMGGMTIIVGLLAVLPLIYFFLIPQMQHQMEDGVSHFPEFQKNVIFDFLLSIFHAVRFGLLPVLEGKVFSLLIWGVIAVFILMTLIAVKYKDRLLNYMLMANIISWVVYYALVKCNFYGYGSVGDRYGLFFIPLWFFTLIYGGYVFVSNLNDKEKCYIPAKTMLWILAGSSVVYCGVGIGGVIKNWQKEDIREMVDLWYDQEGYDTLTFVHQWSDANFQFYLTHDEEYREEYQDNVVAAEKWIRRAGYDEMKQQCEAMGLFEQESFYYVGPLNKFAESTDTFKKVMIDEGYKITLLWEKKGALLHLEK